MKYTFPDSGYSIELQGFNTGTHMLIRGHYEQSYPGKPQPPLDPLEVYAGKPTNTDEFKALNEVYQTELKQYEVDLTTWQNKMSVARWAAVKVYYASCVTDESVNEEAVNKAIADVKSYIDLPQTILDNYRDLGVPISSDNLTKYIYLFHVCISNSGEQTLFEDMLMAGTAPTQEAVRSTLFRFGRKV